MPTPFGDMLASLLSKRPQLTAANEIALPELPVADFLPSCSVRAARIDTARMPLLEPLPLRQTARLAILPARTMPAKPVLGDGRRSTWGVRAKDDPRTRPAAGVQPHGTASSPVPAWEVTLSAGVAIRPVRLGLPADRLPFRLALARGADTLAAELLPAVRLWPHALLSPVAMTGWKCGVLLSRRAPVAVQAATPREWGGAVRQTAMRVAVPDVHLSSARGVFGRASIVRSPWRLSRPAGAAPVEFLEKGSGLLACEYRTRSML